MSRGWYDRLTAKELAGRRVETRREIRTRTLTIPAGSILAIVGKFSGLELKGMPCQCCGVQIMVRRVSPDDVRLLSVEEVAP